MCRFETITPGIGTGSPPSSVWQPINECPLLILVGVTGVGKSTTLDALERMGVQFTLVPDRRLLTDHLIIAHIQAMEQQSLQPVRDRKVRFDYTRRYRERYPGGMAYALSHLCIDRKLHKDRLLFDGLRGENEVTHAADILPQARFVVLDAPDLVRVKRLLSRNDTFDQIASSQSSDGTREQDNGFAELDIAEAKELFTASEREQLGAWVQTGAIARDELRAKLAIVVEERRNYDPAAARHVLNRVAPERTLMIDTSIYSPVQVASQITSWIEI